MKQKLEQVIAEFEGNMEEYDGNYTDRKDPRREYWEGAGDAMEKVISRLKEVIASNDVPTSNRQTSPSGEDDTTQQVQE